MAGRAPTVAATTMSSRARTTTAPTPTSRQRWLARLSLLAFVAAVALLVVATVVRGGWLVLIVVAQIAVALVGGWLAITHRGNARVAAVTITLVLEVAALVWIARHDLLWVVLVSSALLVGAAIEGERALRTPAQLPTSVTPAHRARHAFVVMNPRSGGGKVVSFSLQDQAEQLGADVALLGSPGQSDVVTLAHSAVVNGADLLGAAGGDGTQALVAGIAAEHGLPMIVIPAGTRNHFALDLGLDRDDPRETLNALVDGVDVLVDLGEVDGRPFVNNVSFGAYAAIVARPDYRDDKARVTLDVLPDVLAAHEGPHLTVRVDNRVLRGQQATLVSNNPYGTGDIGGLGRRARMDSGLLGVISIRVDSAANAARVLRGGPNSGLRHLVAREVIVESDTDFVPAAIDGESVMLASPVQCRIQPRRLVVRVPRIRPGVPASHPPPSIANLARLAAPHAHSGSSRT